MTKKIIVLVIAIVLCLSVVGGCFALYSRNAEDITISFGSEGAVNLTLSADGTFNFGGFALSPETKSVTQKITLNVSTTDTSSLSGMYGKLKVELGGAVDSAYYTLSGIATGSGDSPSNASYTQAQLTDGVTLPLDDLPQYLTLTIALTDDAQTPSGFKTISNKNISVKVSWTVVEWTAVDGGFYIVGDNLGGWYVNENSILLNDATSNGDLACKNNISLTAGSYQVVKYTADNGEDWNYKVAWKYDDESQKNVPNIGNEEDDSTPITIDTDNNNNIVVAGGSYFICVNESGAVWIQAQSTVKPSTEN